MKKAERGELEDRWAARPFLAGAVRLVAFALPIVASTLYAFLATAILPRSSSYLTQFVMWAVVAVSSTGVLIVVDHAARRLLPLAALLNLSIVFPDHAPSKFKVARRAGGVRNLEALIDEARGHGADRAPAEAAATILELVTALQFHDRRTRGHSERVHVFAEMLAKELKLPDADRDRLRWAALVHDVGKLTVPVPVLNKPGRPDPDEWAQLRNHPVEGGRLCAPLRDWMGDWWFAIEQHHEHYDGTGYPRGLRGKDISLGARVVAVADSFEVMTAARSYKRAMSVASAREELTRCAGTQFDPDIVRAFLNISIGRMRLAVGPLAGLAQLPGLDQLIRAGSLVRPIAALAAAAGIAATMGAPSVAEQPVDPNVAARSDGTAATVDDVTPAGSRAAGDSEGAPDPEVRPSSPGATGSPVPPAAPAGAPSPPPVLNSAPSSPIGQVVDAPSLALPTPGPTPLPLPTPAPLPPVPPVPPVNLPPLAVADVAATLEDVPVTIEVLRNDADPDGDPLVIVSASDGANGRTTVNGSGTVTYTPDADANGVDTFTYRVSDGTATATATATITVTAVNDPPTAAVDSASLDEDTSVVVDVLANDSDPEGDALSVTSWDAAGVTDGTLAFAGGVFTFTPDPDFAGTQTFDYVVADPAGATATATVTVTVTPLPDDPVARNDSYVAQALTTLTVSVPGTLANDADADDDPLTVSGHTPSTAGTVTLDPDGGLDYDAPALPGTYTFDYTVSDGTGGTDTATVSIDVEALPVLASTFYLGTTGPDGPAGDTYTLDLLPPAAATPEPDHDGDGAVGLSIDKSGGNVDDTDPTKYQHWTRAFVLPTTFTGQVELDLWSTTQDFDVADDGHYHVWLHDCATDGTGCVELLQTDVHVSDWNGGIADWSHRKLALGSIDHTFNVGRMLRVRVMFGHTPMWVAMSQDRPTAITFTAGTP